MRHGCVVDTSVMGAQGEQTRYVERSRELSISLCDSTCALPSLIFTENCCKKVR